MGVALYERETIPDYWVPDTEENQALRLEQQLEQQRRERNYSKIQAASTSWRITAHTVIEGCVDSIRGIYNNSIVPFENMDDLYAEEAERLYDEWAGARDHLTDLAKRTETSTRGLVAGLKEMWEGIYTLGLFIYVGMLPAGTYYELVRQDSPLFKDYNDRMDGMKAGFSLMLKDPFAVAGAMWKDMMDTYEEEGLSYVVSSKLPELVLTLLTMGSWGAARNANMAEDLADAGHTAKITGNLAETVDDITDAAHAANNAEDVLDSLDEIEEMYESIYRAQGEINYEYEEFYRELQELHSNNGGSPDVWDDAIEGGLKTRFVDNIGDILARYGLTLDEFNALRLKDVSTLTDTEKVTLRAIRESIPMPDETTLMQKVIPASDIEKYLDGTYTQVGGFVTKTDDVLQLRNYDDIYNSLRLDYPNTAFNIASDDSLGVIRFTTQETSNIEIPFSSELGGTATGKPPFTGNGFTGATNGQIIPEYQCNSFLTVKEGAELWEIERDGTETLLAVYSELQGKFVEVK